MYNVFFTPPNACPTILMMRVPVCPLPNGNERFRVHFPWLISEEISCTARACRNPYQSTVLRREFNTESLRGRGGLYETLYHPGTACASLTLAENQLDVKKDPTRRFPRAGRGANETADTPCSYNSWRRDRSTGSNCALNSSHLWKHSDRTRGAKSHGSR